MSAQAKTVLLGAIAVVLFVLGSLPVMPRLVSGLFIISAIATLFAIAFVRCPACGERVCRRPTTVFGRRISVGAPFLHSTCYFCGSDLRTPRT
jgi:hypothetical protein